MKIKKRNIEGLNLFSYYRNVNGNTLLHEAVENNDLDAVRYCASHEKLIDAQNDCGETALHLCAQTDNVECAKILIESGCEIEPRNELGWTPLMQAVLSKSIKMIEYLLSVDKKTVFYKKKWGRGYRRMKEQIEFRHNPFVADSKGFTALHFVELLNDKRITELFYEHCWKRGIFTVRNKQLEPNWFDSNFLKVFNGRTFREYNYSLCDDCFAI